MSANDYEVGDAVLKKQVGIFTTEEKTLFQGTVWTYYNYVLQ